MMFATQGIRRLGRTALALALAVGSAIGASAQAAEAPGLVFGTLPIAKPTKLLARYRDLVEYYAKALGQPVRLEIGKDYADAISKFQSGHYDFGFLGPSPYIIATQTSPLGKENFQLAATLETQGKPYYHAVIIASAKDDSIQSLTDLSGKRFAFGSRLSTLSCYMPADMLMQAGVLDKLGSYKFVGKHDVVANAVTLGRFEGGGVKEGIYKKFKDKVRIIAKSEPVWDFMIVAHKKMPPALFEQLKQATLALKDPTILNKIKVGASGFVPTADSNYDNLRDVMKRVDAALGPPQ
jgi:phosphonate transport system substrate-binding protein